MRATATTTRSTPTTPRSSTRPGATAGSRFTNWCADRLIDKPPGLYLSSFRCISAFVRERIVASYEGPYPYVDGLVFQVTQNVGRLQVHHLPRIEGPVELHAAPADAAVALDVPQFLRDAAAASPPCSDWASARWARSRAVIVVVEAIISDKPPQGWASLMVAVLVLAGVQLVVVGLIGEYLGRMFLAVNRKPQYLVREVFRRGAGRAGSRATEGRHARGRAAAPRAFSSGVLNDDGLLRGAGHRHPGRHRRPAAAQGRAPTRRTS